MSITNSQNKKTRWDSILQLFCIPRASSDKETQKPLSRSASATELSHQKLSMETGDELTPRTSIVYDKPVCQPRPSSAPENTSQQPEPSAQISAPEEDENMLRSKFSVRRKHRAPLAETLDQAEVRVGAAPIPAPISPVEPKKCHRRWSSASMNRPASFMLPEGTLKRSASTTIRVGLVTDGSFKPQTPAPVSRPRPSPIATHIYNCIRTNEKKLPPRPPTPPFGKVKMEDIPLPPPLPATFRSASLRKKSLSGVSQWLFYNTDDSHLESATEHLHPMTVKAAISQCFANSPQCHNGSTTTVNTLGHGILSAWSLHNEAAEGEYYQLILESKMSSLSGVALAA